MMLGCLELDSLQRLNQYIFDGFALFVIAMRSLNSTKENIDNASAAYYNII
jgi:hypothetical protein